MSTFDSRDFPGTSELVTRVTDLRSRANDLRRQVDVELAKQKAQRRADLANNWVPAMSAMIVKSQELRFAVAAA